MQNNVARISLKRIRKNAEAVKKAAGGSPLIAVVKDDGYGHGGERVALALSGIAYSFAVATVEEGASLRVAGVAEEILVLTPPLCEEEVLRGAYYWLTFTLSSFAVLNVIARAAQNYQLAISAHIAVNTGMNRYGFRPELLARACKEAKEHGVFVTGVYSHLYAPENEAAREEQAALFDRCAQTVQTFFPHAVRHFAATGGVLAGEKYRFDAVRSGIALYGYLPDGFDGMLDVKPAMKVYTHVAQSGTFTGGGVGYAKADQPYRRLQTLRLGYGDGLFREGTERSVGKLCMDAYVREGRNALGRRLLAVKDIQAYAKAHGTIAYEVLCNLAKKAEKIYDE